MSELCLHWASTRDFSAVNSVLQYSSHHAFNCRDYVRDYANVAFDKAIAITNRSMEVMDKDNLKKVLANLHQELEGADRMDVETRALLQQLHNDIGKLDDASNDADHGASVIEQAESLEARFAAKHPAAEGFVREIIDILGRMGI
jgi:hypothetical protein